MVSFFWRGGSGRPLLDHLLDQEGAEVDVAVLAQEDSVELVVQGQQEVGPEGLLHHLAIDPLV